MPFAAHQKIPETLERENPFEQTAILKKEVA